MNYLFSYKGDGYRMTKTLVLKSCPVLGYIEVKAETM